MAETERSRPPEAGPCPTDGRRAPTAEKPLSFLEIIGEVPEWLNGAVSKTVVPQGTPGSNPGLSAIVERQRTCHSQHRQRILKNYPIIQESTR